MNKNIVIKAFKKKGCVNKNTPTGSVNKNTPTGSVNKNTPTGSVNKNQEDMETILTSAQTGQLLTVMVRLTGCFMRHNGFHLQVPIVAYHLIRKQCSGTSVQRPP